MGLTNDILVVQTTTKRLSTRNLSMILSDVFSRQNNPLDEQEALREHITRALRVKPPTGLEHRLGYRFAQFWCKPTLCNTERIPDRPCLFIGNHALFGLDGLVLLPVMLEELGRFLRPMGDKFLFTQPQIAAGLLRRGATMGHPEVARALMAHDQDILVFPGGAHEAVKASSERYQLQWKDRLGFVRLAAEAGYTIVPFGLVGPDEFYDYLLDSAQISGLLEQLGLWRDGMRRDAVPPLLRGAFGTVLPRPQACFLSFAEPLELPAPNQGQHKKPATKKQLLTWRDTVARRIENEIDDMLHLRDNTRHEHGLLRRLATL